MPKLLNPTKSQLMRMADREFSKYWIRTIGRSEKSKLAHKKLEVCHFKSRDYKCLRYERDNIFVLATDEHFFFHKNPDLFEKFYKEKKGEALLVWLNKKIQNLKPLDIEFYRRHYEKYKKLNEGLTRIEISDTMDCSK